MRIYKIIYLSGLGPPNQESHTYRLLSYGYYCMHMLMYLGTKSPQILKFVALAQMMLTQKSPSGEDPSPSIPEFHFHCMWLFSFSPLKRREKIDLTQLSAHYFI